jgi:competence protein ComFC
MAAALKETSARMIRTLLDIIFPETCLLCGRGLRMGSLRPGPVCVSCIDRLRPLSGRRCLVCGIPLISETVHCTRCRERTFAFDRHWSLFEYRADVRELIYYYKFRGKAGLAAVLATMLHRERPWEGSPDVIVPVPSRVERVRRRGFDHIELLARRLSRLAGIPLVGCLRQKRGRAQKALTVVERLANLRGRIVIPERMRARLAGRVVLLLDDIFTTGATVSECSRVLKNAGASVVYAVTLAQEV